MPLRLKYWPGRVQTGIPSAYRILTAFSKTVTLRNTAYGVVHVY